MTIQDFLQRLTKVRKAGKSWQACCPAHEDRNPSLSITLGSNGRILLKDHAGCSFVDICAALGIDPKDLNPRNKTRSHAKEIVETYDYQDEAGGMLYQKVRYVPKGFTLRRPDKTSRDGWSWKLDGVRRVPFNLPAVIAGIERGDEIWLCEGEKDAQNAIRRGLTATTWDNGATTNRMSEKWRPAYTAILRNAKRVNCLPHHDAAGYHAMRYIGGELLAAGCPDVRMVVIPGQQEHEDASDFFSRGGTVTELQALADVTPVFEPTIEHPREIPVGREDWKTAGNTGEASIIENPEPLRLAERLLRDRFMRDGTLTLRRHSEQWHRYNGTRYELVTDEGLGAEIYRHVDELKTPRRDQNGNAVFGPDGMPVTRKLKPNKSLIAEVAAAAVACDTFVAGNRPRWLRGTDRPDPKEIIACKNGLLHVPTRRLISHTPDFFSSNALDFGYDPDAPDPREWSRFLIDLWPDDCQSIETLREWFGYLLTPDTREQKILLLCGPKRSGKGTIARVLTAMLGPSNIAGPSLASLGLDFGLQSLLDKTVAIISDARIGGRSDGTIITERLLSISGEDLQTVERKHLPAVHMTLPVRFVLLSNELPRLADSSGALASRFILLTLTRSFLGHEDHVLTDRLLKELPGILKWAMAGCDRLHERGHFIQPDSATEAVRELEDLGSPIGAFIRECCIVQPGYSIPVARLYEAWQAWCKDKGRDHSGTVQSFARDLRAAVPGLRTTQPRDPNGRQSARVYEGITLTRHSRNQDLFSFMLHIVLHDAVCYGHEPVYATPRR